AAPRCPRPPPFPRVPPRPAVLRLPRIVLSRTVQVLPEKFMIPPPGPPALSLPPDRLSDTRQLLTVMSAPAPSLSRAPPFPRAPGPPARLRTKAHLWRVAV